MTYCHFVLDKGQGKKGKKRKERKAKRNGKEKGGIHRKAITHGLIADLERGKPSPALAFSAQETSTPGQAKRGAI